MPQTPKPPKAPKDFIAKKAAKPPKDFKEAKAHVAHKPYKTPQCPPPSLSLSPDGDGWRLGLDLRTGFDPASYSSNFEYIITGVYAGGSEPFLSTSAVLPTADSILFTADAAQDWTVSVLVRNNADGLLDSASRDMVMKSGTLTKITETPATRAYADLYFSGVGTDGALTIDFGSESVTITFGFSGQNVSIGTSDDSGLNYSTNDAVANNFVSYLNGLAINLLAEINTSVAAYAVRVSTVATGSSATINAYGDTNMSTIAAIANTTPHGADSTSSGVSTLTIQAGVTGKTHKINYAGFTIQGPNTWINYIEIGYYDESGFLPRFISSGGLPGDTTGQLYTVDGGGYVVEGGDIFARVSDGTSETTEPTGSDALLKIAFTTE